jgi:predicted nucleic acid-binding protein
VNSLVLDANIVAKWFIPEEYSEQARDLMEPGRRFTAPDLLYSEIGNILWKKHGRGEISRPEAREILQAILSLPFEIVASPELASLAQEIAFAAGITFYDGLYVAAAIRHKGVLVTADRKLAKSIRADADLSPFVRWVGAP